MAERPVTVTLASGGEQSSGPGQLAEISRGTRIGRALGFGLGSIVTAAVFLPIPIIHLLAPPAILITGGVLATRQFRATARLLPMRRPCPKCGAMTSLGGGIGIRHPEQPLEVRCGDCRRGLTRTIAEVAGAGDAASD
jgi:hypothetical protein